MMKTRYVGELESVRENLIAMGESTSALLAEALRAVLSPSHDGAEKSRRTRSAHRSHTGAIRAAARGGHPHRLSGTG
jgi:hypothetical protein